MDLETAVGGIIIPAGMYGLVVATNTDSSLPGTIGSMMMTAGIYLICHSLRKTRRPCPTDEPCRH